ncbi:MAG: hypothetical protein RLW62_17085, partial [Gammaproteobacteria bacterium]
MKKAPVRLIAITALVIGTPASALDLIENDRYWERAPEAWDDGHAYAAREHRLFADEHRWISDADRDAWRAANEALLAGIRAEYAAALAGFASTDDDLLAALSDTPAEGAPGSRSLTVYPAWSQGDLAALDDADQRMLDELVTVLAGKREVRLSVTGHSNSVPLSPRAADRYGDNRGLSAARARAVA